MWTIFGKKDVIVEYDGTAVEKEGEGKKKLVFQPCGDTKSLEARILDCHCFSCGEFTMEDPISAIRRCGAEEVRAALASRGFDLDEFDAR